MAVIIIEAAVENEMRGDNKKIHFILHDEICFFVVVVMPKKAPVNA